MPGLQDQFVAFDEALADATRGSRVRLLDWGSRVGAVPISGAGYHPWLNPTDWVHLLPGQAFEQRWALMKSGLDGCLM
jgi:hypothetical protein